MTVTPSELLSTATTNTPRPFPRPETMPDTPSQLILRHIDWVGNVRAGHTAIISAALTALILIALLPQIAPNAPYLPKATTTKTETLTKTTTLTTTTTATTTKTITISNFQCLSKPDKVIQLNSIRKQNRNNLHTLPLLGFLPHKFSPTISKILNTTLKVYQQRKINIYIVIKIVINYGTICKFIDESVKDTFIQYLNIFNKTLPPKHVLEAKDEGWFVTYPFIQHFLIIAVIDGKYMALIQAGYHPPNGDYDYTFLVYNPQVINKTANTALEIFHNFDNPNSGWYGYPIWVWDGCKSHESPWG